MPRRKRPTNYAEQTHASSNLLIRYAHLSRFRIAEQLCAATNMTSVLDWGAGDGYFLEELLRSHPTAGSSFVGAFDPDYQMVDCLTQRFVDSPTNVSIFQDLASLERELQSRSLQLSLVTNFEVMEHMNFRNRSIFYTFLRRYLTEDGKCVLSVPVEIGPTVVIKELGRVFWKGRTREYTTTELLKTALGRPTSDFGRFDKECNEPYIHYHTGFDYRMLAKELSEEFVVEQVIASPIRALPPWMANHCVYFVIHLRL